MTGGRPWRGAGHERGSVTAELAVGLPAVVLVLAMVLGVGSVAITRARCVDGARAGARAAAIGDDDREVGAVARRVAGEDARVGVERAGGWVTVHVETAVAMGPWAGPVRVEARAVGRAEPRTDAGWDAIGTGAGS